MVSRIFKRTCTRNIKSSVPIGSVSTSPVLIAIERDGGSKKICRFSFSILFLSILNRLCKVRIEDMFANLSCMKESHSKKGYTTLNHPAVCEHELTVFNKHFSPELSPRKRTIVLDLDETLVHSTPYLPTTAYDFEVRPILDGEELTLYVTKRPGVDKFLEELRKKYEVVVFTAGLKEYALQVLDKLDMDGVISTRLFRESCTEIDGKFVKDLRVIGKDLRDVVLVDDNPNCYVFQPGNAVPIKAFVGDRKDGELLRLGRFFVDKCDPYEDMRDAVKDYLSGVKNI